MTHYLLSVHSVQGEVREPMTDEEMAQSHKQLGVLEQEMKSAGARVVSGRLQLTRFLVGQGEWVVEIDRPTPPRGRHGVKSDVLDAVRAGREALARDHLPSPRQRGRVIVEESGVGADRQHILQFMTTEHFTLQTARAVANAEITGRLQLYLGTLSSAIIALALTAQLSGLGVALRGFALVLRPVVFFLGTSWSSPRSQTGGNPWWQASTVAFPADPETSPLA
jgi:hypothetical protein